MGHVLFAAPPIQRLHLHERLGQQLTSRGHRVTVLASDPFAAAMFAAQTMAVRELRPATPMTSHAPLQEFALLDHLATGRPAPGRMRLRRTERRLSRRVRSLELLLETDRPDLVLFHQGRSGVHRLLHFAAREHGIPILHTGDGLLPGTMQWDSEGIDGGASACRRTAQDYRSAKRDPRLLKAALSSWLSRACPPPLPRHPLALPGPQIRLACLGEAALQGDGSAAWRALTEWSRTAPIPRVAPPAHEAAPQPPFVVVLLQPPRCPRLHLDAPPGQSAVELALATRTAARHIDHDLRVVAILPERGFPARDAALLQRHGLRVVPAGAAPTLIATALAAVTVNHPLGLGALLADTPVVHTGNTPYAVRGVATRSATETLRHDLPGAIERQQRTLQERFLSRYLLEDTVWCSADFPDHNGLGGLVVEIEKRLRDQPQIGPTPTYRAGPAWPLQTGNS